MADGRVAVAEAEIGFGQGVQIGRVVRIEFDGPLGVLQRFVQTAMAAGGYPGQIVVQQRGLRISLQLVRKGGDHLVEQLVGLRLPAGLLQQRHQVLGQLRVGRRGSQRQFDFAAGPLEIAGLNRRCGAQPVNRGRGAQVVEVRLVK